MKVSTRGFAALLALAGIGLWMLIAGTGRLFGIDTGMVGIAFLITATWLSLYAVSVIPGGEFEQRVSPGEWQAWIGLGFMAIATVYFVSKLSLFQGEAFPTAHHARAVVRNLVLLLIAWAVLSNVLASRWNNRVQSDERDRQIETTAERWGHTTLIVAVIALAVLLGFSPVDRLAWASHFMIANLIIATLMVGWLVEHAGKVWMYWRDRR